MHVTAVGNGFVSVFYAPAHTPNKLASIGVYQAAVPVLYIKGPQIQQGEY